MSVNLKYAVDKDKAAKLGEFIPSIDFEVNSSSKETIDRKGPGTIAGTFHIGNQSYKLSLAELDYIVQTCEVAKRTFFQKYRFGF